jgi:hypothetical protein
MGYPSNEPDEFGEEDSPETQALYAELEGKTVQEILREGQKALFVDLVVKVRNGKANHQEKSILRNLLKDNGLVLGIPPEKPAEQTAPVDLPDFETPDYE